MENCGRAAVRGMLVGSQVQKGGCRLDVREQSTLSGNVRGADQGEDSSHQPRKPPAEKRRPPPKSAAP